MAHVRFCDLRRSLKTHLDRVGQDRLELVVRRRNHEDMVIVPLADLNAMLRLLGEPEVGRAADPTRTGP